MKTPQELPPPEHQEESATWQYGRRGPDLFERVFKLMVIAAILAAVIVPFTPLASRIKKALKDIKEPTYVTREVIKRVEVPAPPPPLPDRNIPRKDVDVAELFNGISINTNLVTIPGGFASLERLDPESYKVQFQVDVRIPKANQSVAELARINPHLPAILPGLESMLPSSKVSGFFHKLYENKTKSVGQNLTRLNKILDRHNFYDCETILELQHETTGRKALLIQSEMDVVSDGSDGDRMSRLADYISMSDNYQPFTSYAWNKLSKTPNPLLARWEARLDKANADYAVKGLSAEKNRQLKATIDQLKLEIKDLKGRSSLIAEADPFVVISLLFRNYEGTNPFTPQIGDYAVVVHDQKVYPAICGDYGPSFKMGEASLFMAKAISEKATPYNRPVSDLKVSYIVFPGTRVKPFGPPNLEDWRSKCIGFLNEIGGIGAGFEVHKWDDKFKKAVPEATPSASPTSVAPEAPKAQ
ncbi:MAG: glycoside hydrolase family 75 protein [Verrucomicrobiaceae bacterium]|nr:glycoside hydrolase family 75 protein [Verrucomicrobiaceae bacterium]